MSSEDNLRWAIEGYEYLNPNLDACIKQYIDEGLVGGESGIPPEEWPEEITIQAWRPISITPERMEPLLEDLLENLDQDFGDLEKATEPSEGIQKAWGDFSAVVMREYPVHQCRRDPDHDRVINIKEWIERK